MFNPAQLFKLKGLQNKFVSDHPKFTSFLSAVSSRGLNEGTVVEISITYPDGSTMESNIRLTANDINSYHELKNMSGK